MKIKYNKKESILLEKYYKIVYIIICIIKISNLIS
uniref:Uncharacterized protein n=1 Tax=Clostridium perfringens TaxID=1502 RepID=A0A4Y5T3T5_CLOPF|nr:hypothetical protein [Clostridium perfringens]